MEYYFKNAIAYMCGNHLDREYSASFSFKGRGAFNNKLNVI